MRENGLKTYFASDIAYHLQKRERGFDKLVDVLGADHHGYVARVRAGLVAMGEPGDSLEVRLVQFVTLYRGGEKVQMSTRSGEFITLRELRREVGNDAARFFYVMRSNDQHLDFDLQLATSHSNENPVYYIQYAHARVCSVMRQMREKGFEHDAAARPRGARAAGRAARAGAARLAEPLSRGGGDRRRCSARRTRWCTTCASSPTTSTPTTTPTSSWWTTPTLRDARLTLIQGAAAGGAQRARAARRVGARGDVSVATGKTLQPRLQARQAPHPGRRATSAAGSGSRPASRSASPWRSACTCTTRTAEPAVPQPDGGRATRLRHRRRRRRRRWPKAKSRPDYDFYDMLPKQEVEVPGERAAGAQRRARRCRRATSRCRRASFKQAAEAEKLQARLAQYGIDAKIQRFSLEDETWYRVRIGPIATVEELEPMRAKLAEAEVDAMPVTAAAAVPPP